MASKTEPVVVNIAAFLASAERHRVGPSPPTLPGFKCKMQSLEINSTIRLSDPKGGDPSEWPKDLQVREYPKTKEIIHGSAANAV